MRSRRIGFRAASPARRLVTKLVVSFASCGTKGSNPRVYGIHIILKPREQGSAHPGCRADLFRLVRARFDGRLAKARGMRPKVCFVNIYTSITIGIQRRLIIKYDLCQYIIYVK